MYVSAVGSVHTMLETKATIIWGMFWPDSQGRHPKLNLEDLGTEWVQNYFNPDSICYISVELELPRKMAISEKGIQHTDGHFFWDRR